MQQLPVTMYERVVLWNICGGHQVRNLKEAAVFLRLIEKLRLTDTETREAKYEQTAEGFRWIAPSPVYGNRVIELEDAEGKALAEAMEAHEPVRIRDAAWMMRITDLLAAPDGQPEEQPAQEPAVAGV